MDSILRPGATIGIVGGGQLGRMLAQAARRQGYRVVVFTGGAKDTPAGVLADEEIAADFTDEPAIAQFVAAVDVVTWEFENVQADLAHAAAQADVPVRPSGAIIATAQDRQLEKEALTALGVPVAAWRPATNESELAQAVEVLGAPAIAKAARFGYDGKGQRQINSISEVGAVWQELGEQRLVVEAVVPFEVELSVVVARSLDGVVADHGVMENDHVDHILDSTVVPARVDSDVASRARALAQTIAAGLELVGVLCVELFATADGLVVNEIAPRPHNSGHCTIEAAAASQFEQQLRAICGMSLGDGLCRPSAMVQLLGDLWADGEPAWETLLVDPTVQLHLYGKAEPRRGRKMGHLTAVGTDPTILLNRLLAARDSLEDS